MKIRKGYVSNSSSASFVVQVRDINFCEKNTRKITKKQEEFLVDNNFKYVQNLPRNILNNGCSNLTFINKKDDNEEYPLCMYFEVICNEDEILDMLFEQKIPFYALVHYDDWFYVYNGKSDYYEIFPNYVSLYPYNTSNKWQKDWFYKKDLMKYSYRRVYFNEKVHENNDDFVEYLDDLQFSIDNMQTEMRKTFNVKELKKIKKFLLNSWKERANLKKKLDKF